MLEAANNGEHISMEGLGSSFKRLPTKEHLVMGGEQEESVDDLLDKLARKGKKVKVIEGHEDDFDGDRIEEDIHELEDSPEEIRHNPHHHPKVVKKRKRTIITGEQKQEGGESPKKASPEEEKQEKQQLEKLIKEMEQRMVIGG